MRGKVDGNLFIDGTYRITPAYAGKSIDEVYNVIGYKDHPRLCGEKYFLGMKSEKFNGITPAYAGKRLFQHPFSSLRRDHPRLCGEKSKVMYRTMPSEGSPPPMRGKANQNRQLHNIS